jgi:hypothetical protein
MASWAFREMESSRADTEDGPGVAVAVFTVEVR